MEEFKQLAMEKLFALIGVLGFLGGLMRVMNYGKDPTMRDVLNSALSGSLVAVIIGFLLFERFSDSTALLIGVAGLAGFGGVAVLAVMFEIGKKLLEKHFKIDAKDWDDKKDI